MLENLDWSDFLDRYDRPGPLLYFDPPYFGGEDDYGKTLFRREQFAAMAKRLLRLKGRFLPSIKDVLEIRQIFAGFDFNEAELTYTVSAGRATAARELIISG